MLGGGTVFCGNITSATVSAINRIYLKRNEAKECRIRDNHLSSCSGQIQFEVADNYCLIPFHFCMLIIIRSMENYCSVIDHR